MAIIDWFVLPTIVFAQFAGTSLWFAPNAVITQVGFDPDQVSILTSCVQAGFIFGTLTFTYFTITDRFSPPALFAIMAWSGAILNAICITSSSFEMWATLRFCVGFTLAGIYPVGMKIAAQEYIEQGLGARLGVLVGALTLGTAFPWLVRGVGDSSSSSSSSTPSSDTSLPFEATIGIVSILASVGGALMALVMIPRQGGPGAVCLGSILACCSTGSDDGSIHQEGETKSNQKSEVDVIEEAELPPDIHNDQNGEGQTNSNDNDAYAENTTEEKQLTGISALKAILDDARFRAAAIGYFGHMWELYAFWAYVPSLIESHSEQHGGCILSNVAFTSFTTIAIGSVSCALAGLWSLRAGRNILPGSAVAAEVALLTSLICCLLAPVYLHMSPGVFLFYLLVWGSAVVADSAQFSSLCAAYACPNLVGTALTLTTCIGFSITIASIQMVGGLLGRGWDPGEALALLSIGPFFGMGWSYKQWPLHTIVKKKG